MGDAGKKPDEYKGVAKFLTYLVDPQRQASGTSRRATCRSPPAAYEITKKSGFYEKNPGTDVSVRQMMNKPATANSKGLRFGSFVQIRDIIEEEFENMLAGKKDAKEALDNAVEARQRDPAAVREDGQGQPS